MTGSLNDARTPAIAVWCIIPPVQELSFNSRFIIILLRIANSLLGLIFLSLNGLGSNQGI